MLSERRHHVDIWRVRGHTSVQRERGQGDRKTNTHTENNKEENTRMKNITHTHRRTRRRSRARAVALLSASLHLPDRSPSPASGGVLAPRASRLCTRRCRRTPRPCAATCDARRGRSRRDRRRRTCLAAALAFDSHERPVPYALALGSPRLALEILVRALALARAGVVGRAAPAARTPARLAHEAAVALAVPVLCPAVAAHRRTDRVGLAYASSR